MLKNYNLKLSKFMIIVGLFYYITIVQKLVWFSYYTVFKCLVLIITAIFLFTRFYYIKKSLDAKITIFLILFSLSIVYTSMINTQNIKTRNVFLVTITLMVTIWEIYFLIAYAKTKKLINPLINLYFKLTLITTIIVDIGVLFVPTIEDGNYLIGTKFAVVYLHLILLTFYLMIKNIEKKGVNWIIFGILCLITIEISIIVECMTGIVAILIYILCYCNKNVFKKIFYSAKGFIVSILLVDSFAIIYNVILSNVHIQNIISNVLNRSLTLTGRIYIYEQLPLILGTNLVWGNGCGSAYEIMQRFTPYADAQNGLAQWILQIGIVGTMLLFLILLCPFINSNKKFLKNGATEILILIFVFIVLSSVEITFDMLFITLIFIFYGLQEKN